VHAVSVGEVQAAVILIEALRQRSPHAAITLSCATPSARARGRALLPQIAVRYAPYDLPGCVRRCLAVLRPQLLIVLEAELWPNLLHQAVRERVPVLFASARVSARSAKLYRHLPGLLQQSLAAAWVGAQTQADAQRFGTLGVSCERCSIVGNIKFDRHMPAQVRQRGAQLRERYAAARPVWIAGSTHAGEERIVLEAHRRVCADQPRTLLIMAPRHAPRFDEAAASVRASGFSCQRRSTGPPPQDYQVLLLDTLGELTDFYAAADLAFVGGSLVPIGGHNLLEPAALGLPVLTGPAQFNSPEIARILCQRGAVTIVRDADELGAAVRMLLADPQRRAAQGAAGQAAIEANRGALTRLIGLIERIEQAASSASGPSA
jgi:3-deoxy-D-manno-octulosonic-acid transferase